MSDNERLIGTLTSAQRRVLVHAVQRHTAFVNSGRYGFSISTLRVLEKWKLAVRVSTATWDCRWRLTNRALELGRLLVAREQAESVK